MSNAPIPIHLRLSRLVAGLNSPILVVGALAGLTGRRWGAYVLVLNVTIQIGFHLLVGWQAYRDVMSRPWPSVPPLVDDDWDD